MSRTMATAEARRMGLQSADIRFLRTGVRIPPAVSAAGRQAQWERIAALLDPAGQYPAAERERRAKVAWRAFMRARRNHWTDLPLMAWLAEQLYAAEARP